ncbi:hypothetical protein Tco_0337439 [Tanacetum coccineum]
MASKSSSQPLSKQLTPASNVNFQMADFIIQFNNGVALLELKNSIYKRLFQFLKKSVVYVALSKEPSAYYTQYLWEFWYTAEADTSTNTITFSLSHLEKLLTFNLETFSIVIGLKFDEGFVDLPKKEILKAGLATLGLFDEKKTLFVIYCSHQLFSRQRSHDHFNFNHQTIACSLCWGLNIDIAGILFSDLIAQLHPETVKKERKPNICFSRYLSLVMEHLMKEQYKNDKLTSLKAHKITSVTLKTPLQNEVPLTAHMCNVAKISPLSIQTLIPPSGEVNADDSADKSLFGTSPKATTAKKPRKKKIPSSTQPEVLKSSRIQTSSSSQATHLQPAEEFMATADETKSIETSKLAEVQDNQPKAADTTEVLDTIMEENVEEKEDVEDHSSNVPTVEKLLEEVDKQNFVVQHTQESHFDTESEIRFVKSFHASQIIQTKTDSTQDAEATLMDSGPINMDSEFELEYMPDDDLQSLLGFETPVSDDSRHEVSDAIESFVPDLISHSLNTQLPGPLSDALRDCLPQLLKESLTTFIPTVTKSVVEEQAQFNKRVVKHMNRQFNISHKAESLRFISFHKALSNVLKTEMGASISSKVSLGMKDVITDLITQTKHLLKYCLSVQDMHSQLQEVRELLEAAVIMDDHAEREKSKKDQRDENTNPAIIQGEHSNTKENAAIPDAQENAAILDASQGSTSCFKPLCRISHHLLSENQLLPKTLPKIKKIKMWADLKEQDKKSEEELKKLLNPATVKAQALKWEEHEEKKSKMLNEFKTCISKRTNPLPITKISYIINSQKEPTMRITRDNDPLNLTVYPNFRLIILGFSEWLEVNALASKKLAKRLGLPPPPELATFGLTAEDKKRKRSEIIKEVFVKERIEVDGTQRNLTPPSGVVGNKGLVIRESEAGFFYFNANFDLVFQRESKFHITSIIQLIRLLKQINQDSSEAREMYKIMEIKIESRDDVNKDREIVRTNSDGMGINLLSVEEPLSTGLRGEEDQLSAKHHLPVKGLSECEASESNIRRIQVKDIVKEVEDYLKTYSPSGMDISLYIEGIR